MYKYTKATKSCFAYENLKNKKSTLNTAILNKAKIDETNCKINKTNINKNLPIKKEAITLKLINKKITFKNNNGNKKKINDYFNTLVKDSLKTNDLCKVNNKEESKKDDEQEKLQLKIPDSFKNQDTILPPINFKYQIIPQKTPLKTQQTHLETDNDGKVIFRKKGLSENGLKKCLMVIYDDVMIDNFENNQEQIDKTNNTTTTIKIKHDLNKDFYKVLINEIKSYYNDSVKQKSDSNVTNDQKQWTNDHTDIDYKCKLKTTSIQKKALNKILDDIYSLNINDSLNTNNKVNLYNNVPIDEFKSTTRKIIQKTPPFTTQTSTRTLKRKFSNTTKKLNVKQTKLNFSVKRQKTI